jgi:hypothetical protein
MTAWKIVSGPRAYETEEGSDRDAGRGWTYDIERDGGRRQISVEVAETIDAGNATSLDDAQRALSTQGRSAVEAVLEQVDPSPRLMVTSHGVLAADEA